MVIPPSREVWCTEMLAAAAEVRAATIIVAQARALIELANVAMASPADLSEKDRRRIAGPLVAQMAVYVERVAP